LAKIGDRVSQLKNLLMVQMEPNVFVVANEAISAKIDIPYENRFDTDKITDVFTQVLVAEGLVNQKEIERGEVLVRGNIKPASALIKETFKDETVRNRVNEVAKQTGYQSDAEIDEVPLFREIQIFDELIRNLNEGRFDGEQREAVENLVKEIKGRMTRQYDVVRARIYFDSPKSLNLAIAGVVNRVKLMEGRSGDAQPQVYIRKSSYPIDQKTHPERKKIAVDNLAEDYVYTMAQAFAETPDDMVNYVAVHSHIPVRGKVNATVELQMALSDMRPVLEMLDVAYKLPGMMFILYPIIQTTGQEMF